MLSEASLSLSPKRERPQSVAAKDHTHKCTLILQVPKFKKCHQERKHFALYPGQVLPANVEMFWGEREKVQDFTVQSFFKKKVSMLSTSCCCCFKKDTNTFLELQSGPGKPSRFGSPKSAFASQEEKYIRLRVKFPSLPKTFVTKNVC